MRSPFSLLFALAIAAILLFQACSASGGDPTTDRMAKEHRGDRPVPTAVASAEPAVPVVAEEVTYATIDGEDITGYFARPEASEDGLPGILAIHEWWGLNDNIRATARRLAGEGYAVLAVDLYGDRVAEVPDEARNIMRSVLQNPEPARENLRQAYDYLTRDRKAPKVGSIGWCFGGGWSLQAGLLLPNDLDAVAIYYGRLETDPAVLEPLQMPILGIFGAEDRGIPVEDARAFETALRGLGKDAEIHIYENAGHAFANPSGRRYVPEAAEDAWAKTTAFFDKHLQNG